jgi:hypothetical protein
VAIDVPGLGTLAVDVHETTGALDQHLLNTIHVPRQ